MKYNYRNQSRQLCNYEVQLRKPKETIMQLWRTIIDAKGGNYAIMKSQKCNYATVLEPWSSQSVLKFRPKNLKSLTTLDLNILQHFLSHSWTSSFSHFPKTEIFLFRVGFFSIFTFRKAETPFPSILFSPFP